MDLLRHRSVEVEHQLLVVWTILGVAGRRLGVYSHHHLQVGDLHGPAEDLSWSSDDLAGPDTEGKREGERANEKL